MRHLPLCFLRRSIHVWRPTYDACAVCGQCCCQTAPWMNFQQGSHRNTAAAAVSSASPPQGPAGTTAGGDAARRGCRTCGWAAAGAPPPSACLRGMRRFRQTGPASDGGLCRTRRHSAGDRTASLAWSPSDFQYPRAPGRNPTGLLCWEGCILRSPRLVSCVPEIAAQGLRTGLGLWRGKEGLLGLAPHRGWSPAWWRW